MVPAHRHHTPRGARLCRKRHTTRPLAERQNKKTGRMRSIGLFPRAYQPQADSPQPPKKSILVLVVVQILEIVKFIIEIENLLANRTQQILRKLADLKVVLLLVNPLKR